MAHDVFISHSHVDKPVADALCATMEARGIRCWIAPRDIIPGANWGEAIIDGINGSKLLLLIFSSNSNSSPQVIREVERAVSKGIPIVPVRIEEVKPTQAMEYFISSAHWLDALTPPLERYFNKVTDTVELLLQRIGAQPSIRRSLRHSLAGLRKPVAMDYRLVSVAAIILIFLAVTFAGYKFLSNRTRGAEKETTAKEAPTESVSSDNDEPSVERPREETVKAGTKGIDKELQGDWNARLTVDGAEWDCHLNLSESRYSLIARAQDRGKIEGRNGRWRTVNDKGRSTEGTYVLTGSNSMRMIGPTGPSDWLKSRSVSRVMCDSDPDFLGYWKLGALVNGLQWDWSFDMYPDCQYSFTGQALDRGTMDAADGRFIQVSSSTQQVFEGNYRMLASDSAEISGAFGKVIWTRK